MIRTKDEILEQVKQRIGEDTSDEALAFIEDITDTINDLNTKVSDTTDWKAKFEENDREWRTKYRERFFNSDEIEDDKTPDKPEAKDEDKPKDYSYENLFKEE